MTVRGSALCLSLLALPGLAAAWVNEADGKPAPCTTVSTLDDAATGWPGACLDLEQQTKADSSSTYTAQECADLCKANPECTVWQLTGGDTPDQCYIGKPGSEPRSCLGRDADPDFKPKGAQRIQHGEVTVLQNYTGTWISNLYKEGIFPSSEEALSKARCKRQCYSDINCEYWQYGKEGCFRETKATKVPTTGPVTSTTSDEAKTQVDGEKISHSCPLPVTPPPPDHTLRNVLLALLALLLLLAICIGIYFAFCNKKETKPKRTRAVKTVPKEEPLVMPAVQYVTVPQYQVVQQQAPMMVQQAPMMYQQAPPVMGSSVVMPAAGSMSVPMATSMIVG